MVAASVEAARNPDRQGVNFKLFLTHPYDGPCFLGCEKADMFMRFKRPLKRLLPLQNSKHLIDDFRIAGVLGGDGLGVR